jgi:hypothetical protein
LTFEERLDATLAEIRKLLIDKHKDYGETNLDTWGELGIAVRISDKESRLRNLLRNNDTPRCESVRDTGIDIAGYGIRLVMMLDSHQQKPHRVPET